MFSFFKTRRRQKLLAGTLSAAWREILARNVAVYSRLSAWERPRLEAALRVIVAERRFVGVGGVVITDEVKVTIAAQAALLLLGEDGYYFDKVPTIFVFPQPRPDKVGRTVQHGMPFSAGAHVIEEDVIVSGWAHADGEVRLAWNQVLAGGRNECDGQNVVLHEFAHHLDGLDGEMGGTPPLPDEAARLRWWQTLDFEMAQLHDDLAAGYETLLPPAASENRAELFAYSTVLFFERPAELHDGHEELYERLQEFYKVDPRSWFTDRGPDEPYTRPFEAAVPRMPLPSEEEPSERVEKDELPELETADQYFTRGLEFYEAGEFAPAATDFDAAVKLSPQDQEAVLYRGRARFYLEEHQAALSDAERACRLAPGDAEAVALRGLCQIALGEHAAGLADLEAVAAELPDDLDVLYYRGLARAELGQSQAAIADFTRLLQLDPKDAHAWRERSLCYSDLGDESAAASDMAQARALGWQESEPDDES